MSEPYLAARLRNATPIAAVIVYFILGYAAGGWAWGWIVFLAVPLVYALVPGERHRRPVDLSKSEDSA